MGFKLEAFQNRHLPPGQSRVDGIVSVTADAAVTASGEVVVGFILDKSGSMKGERLAGVVGAVARAIDLLDARAWFFVVAFDGTGHVICPLQHATIANKRIATNTIRSIEAMGGTAMSTGLHEARRLFDGVPNAIRQAIFLTDGKNEGEQKEKVLAELRACEGVFECDCWGVGTDWQVGEVQEIARALLGKASLIPEPAGVEEAFRRAIEKASGKSLKDVRLRIWTPQGAELVFVKQVNPTIEDFTAKARVVTPQVREYLTGSWGAGEARDFHMVVQVSAGKVGDEMLAARPSIVYLASDPSSPNGWSEREEKAPEARLFATWTADDSLSSRLDHHVAHYTGQDELAAAIEQGLAARETGNEGGATQLLGRAVQIAHASGNAEMTHRLQKVVDVVDASTGTVRLRKQVTKAAEMDLQLESRTTKRVAKKREGA
jgi:hypothetical protein